MFRSKLFHTMVISNQLFSFSPCLNWLTMQLTTKATKKSKDARDLMKANVIFSILLFPLPEKSFFSLLGFNLKSTYSKMPFRISQVELISPPPTIFKKTPSIIVIITLQYYILVLKSLWPCLCLDDPQVFKSQEGRGHSLTIFGAMLSKERMLHVCLFELVKRIT